MTGKSRKEARKSTEKPNKRATKKSNKKNESGILSKWLPIWVNILILGTSVAILVVALCTIFLQSKQGEILEDFAKTVKNFTEWEKAERARKPVLYLSSPKVWCVGEDSIRTTFSLANKGNAIAEKVQIRFRLPECFEPSGKNLHCYIADSAMEGKRYLKYPSSAKDVEEKFYSTEDPSEPFETPLSCTLDFVVPPESVDIDSLTIHYSVDCASLGSTLWQALKVSNCLKKSTNK